MTHCHNTSAHGQFGITHSAHYGYHTTLEVAAATKGAWQVVGVMVEHACYLTCRCFRGTDGQIPFRNSEGYDSNKALIKFGEQIWANLLGAKEGNRRACLDSSRVPALWTGINTRSGRPLLIFPFGGALASHWIRNEDGDSRSFPFFKLAIRGDDERLDKILRDGTLDGCSKPTSRGKTSEPIPNNCSSPRILVRLVSLD